MASFSLILQKPRANTFPYRPHTWLISNIYIYIYIYIYNNVLRIAVFLVRAFNLVLQVFIRLCGIVLGEMFLCVFDCVGVASV